MFLCSNTLFKQLSSRQSQFQYLGIRPFSQLTNNMIHYFVSSVSMLPPTRDALCYCLNSRLESEKCNESGCRRIPDALYGVSDAPVGKHREAAGST